MNNISTSDCSSGCESGWTTYFYELSNSTHPHDNSQGGNVNNDHDDQSMVSDASSAPPKLHENYEVEPHSFGSSSASLKQVKKKAKQKSITKETRMMMKRNCSLCLEDTASSPFLHFSQDNAVTHQNHNSSSSANVEEENIPENSLRTSKSSNKGKSGSLKGRKRQ